MSPFGLVLFLGFIGARFSSFLPMVTLKLIYSQLIFSENFSLDTIPNIPISCLHRRIVRINNVMVFGIYHAFVNHRARRRNGKLSSVGLWI